MDRSARNVELLKQQQLTNQKRVEDLMNTRYSVRAQLVELQAEKASLAREIAVNERANQEADSTYNDLKQLYNSGILIAPVSGTVGTEVASPGSVLVPGDNVLDIYSGAPYVMAYMPDSYLFELKQFEKVAVSSGRERAVGRVDEILPLADNLPVEFQNTFSSARPQPAHSHLARRRATLSGAAKGGGDCLQLRELRALHMGGERIWHEALSTGAAICPTHVRRTGRFRSEPESAALAADVQSARLGRHCACRVCRNRLPAVPRGLVIGGEGIQ